MSVKLTDDFFQDMASSPLITAECSQVCLYLYISLKGGPQRTTCRKSRVDAVMVGGNEGRSTPQHLIHSLVRVSFCSEEAEKLDARFPRLPFSCGSGSNLR